MSTEETSIIFRGKVIYSSNHKSGLIPPDKLLYDRHQVKDLLRPHFDNKSNYIGIFLSQISVAITIFLTVLVSDIKPKWGITSEFWTGTIWVCLSFISAWTIYVTYKILTQPSYDQFMDKLIKASQTTPDRRFVLLIIALDQNGNRKILAERSIDWDCWLLPNFGKTKSTEIGSEENLKTFLSEKFSAVKNEISIATNIGDLITYKTSYKDGKFKNYYFDFQLIKLSPEAASQLLDNEFTINGVKYRWFTTTELLADRNTKERNGDVINHIHDKIFPENQASLSFREKLR